MALVKQSRLSVMPVTGGQFHAVAGAGGNEGLTRFGRGRTGFPRRAVCLRYSKPAAQGKSSAMTSRPMTVCTASESDEDLDDGGRRDDQRQMEGKHGQRMSSQKRRQAISQRGGCGFQASKQCSPSGANSAARKGPSVHLSIQRKISGFIQACGQNPDGNEMPPTRSRTPPEDHANDEVSG